MENAEREQLLKLLDSANEKIKMTPVKGKQYAEVNQRVAAFRRVYPGGSIKTRMLSDEDGRCVFAAEVRDDEGQLLGTGTAFEVQDSSYINRTSYIENCETSAVGRALGFAGFGIGVSIASAEEVENALEQQAAGEQISEQEAIVLSNLLGTDENRQLVIDRYGPLEELTRAQYAHVITSFNSKKSRRRRNGEG